MQSEPASLEDIFGALRDQLDEDAMAALEAENVKIAVNQALATAGTHAQLCN